MFIGAPIERFGYLLPVCLLCLVKQGRLVLPLNVVSHRLPLCPQILPPPPPSPAPYMVRYVPFQDCPHRCFERDERDFSAPWHSQVVPEIWALYQLLCFHSFSFFAVPCGCSSSPVRDWTCALHIGRASLNHWTIREDPKSHSFEGSIRLTTVESILAVHIKRY